MICKQQRTIYINYITIRFFFRSVGLLFIANLNPKDPKDPKPMKQAKKHLKQTSKTSKQPSIFSYTIHDTHTQTKARTIQTSHVQPHIHKPKE